LRNVDTNTPDGCELASALVAGADCPSDTSRTVLDRWAQWARDRWKNTTTPWFRFSTTIITVMASRGLLGDEEAEARLRRWSLVAGARSADRRVLGMLLTRAMTAQSEEEIFAGMETHVTLATSLQAVMRAHLGPAHTVRSHQHVYWEPFHLRRSVSPALFVKLYVPHAPLVSPDPWKVWERGAPDLALEITSPNWGDDISWEETLSRYRELGVDELVRFEPNAAEGNRLHIWDRVHDELLERDITADQAAARTLGLDWIVCPVDGESVGLTLGHDHGRRATTARQVPR
jgi:hypothetical protein